MGAFSESLNSVTMKVLLILCLTTLALAQTEVHDDGIFKRVETLIKSAYNNLGSTSREEADAEPGRRETWYEYRSENNTLVRADCNCNADGSEDLTCDATGKCHCKCNVDGDKCDTCQAGWHSFPACHECNCNQEGSENTMCDVNTGKCPCKTALIVGDQCDACAVGNFNFPNCEDCQCHGEGATSNVCDNTSGKCTDCKDNVTGDKCSQCIAEYYGFPNCEGRITDKILSKRSH